MAQQFGIKVEGIPQTKVFMNKKLKLALSKADKGIQEAGRFVYAEVKQSIAGRRAEPTSVDTGRFLNSISIDFKKLQAFIKANVKYAKFLEFGTSRLNARHHFRNTKARNQKKVVEFIQKEVNKI